MFVPSKEGTGAGPVVMRNSVFCADADPAPAPPTPPVAAVSARDTVPGRRCRSWNAWMAGHNTTRASERTVRV